MSTFHAPWTAHDQTPVWSHHSADSYQSPRPGRGRSHSYLPTRPQRYSSILVWWRWGPGHYHRDWHRWDYSSILSFLLWVAPSLCLNSEEKGKRVLTRRISSVPQQSRRHGDSKHRMCPRHSIYCNPLSTCSVEFFRCKIKMHWNPELWWIIWYTPRV